MDTSEMNCCERAKFEFFKKYDIKLDPYWNSLWITCDEHEGFFYIKTHEVLLNKCFINKNDTELLAKWIKLTEELLR